MVDWLRREVPLFLEILGLSAFAFAQPILDVFGKSPETFVFREAGRLEIVLFAVVVSALPATGLWGILALTGAFGRQVRARAQFVVVAALASVVGIQVLKKATPLLDLPLLLAGLAVGVLGALFLLRARVARMWARYLSLAPVAFVLIFLLVSPVSKLIFPAPAGASAGEASPTSVVLLILDEFPLLSILDREGSIDRTLYPNLADLATRSTWFKNVTTIDPATKRAVPALLTGNLARDRSKAPLVADYPNNLFTLLRESHRLVVSETLTQLCPPDACLSPEEAERSGEPEGGDGEEPDPAAENASGGSLQPVVALLGDALGIWADLSGPGEVTRDIYDQFAEDPGDADAEDAGGAVPGGEEAPAPRATESPDPGQELGRQGKGLASFEAFLRSLERSGEPSLYFLHVLIPHTPWQYLPSGTKYERLGGFRDLAPINKSPVGWQKQRWPVQLTRQRHLLQVQYVDRMIGLLTNRLEESGLYDDVLLVVTSDHGISLHPGRPWRRVTNENLHEILWVPMFIKAPGQQEGGPDGRNFMTPDLMPTMADALGIEIPWNVDGVSMLDPKAGRGPVKHLDVVRDKDADLRPSITLTEAWRLLRNEAFTPAVPSDDPGLWPYLVGPRPELIGRPLDDLTMGPSSGLSAELALPRDPSRMERSEPLPSLMWGRVVGHGAERASLVAIALNGRVAAVSETWASNDGTPGRFGALIPEPFFRPRRNLLELFALEGDVLRPLGLTG